MKRVDCLYLSFLCYFTSSQFSPCQKLIFDEEVFSAGSAGSFPLREIFEWYENIANLCIYPLSLFSVFYKSGDKSSKRPSNHHPKNQAPSCNNINYMNIKNINNSMEKHQADSLFILLFLHNTYLYLVCLFNYLFFIYLITCDL